MKVCVATGVRGVQHDVYVATRCVVLQLDSALQHDVCIKSLGVVSARVVYCRNTGLREAIMNDLRWRTARRACESSSTAGEEGAGASRGEWWSERAGGRASERSRNGGARARKGERATGGRVVVQSVVCSMLFCTWQSTRIARTLDAARVTYMRVGRDMPAAMAGLAIGDAASSIAVF
jgi:hypothetical protein